MGNNNDNRNMNILSTVMTILILLVIILIATQSDLGDWIRYHYQHSVPADVKEHMKFFFGPK